MLTAYEIYPLGDHALTISFGDQINRSTHHKVLQLFRHLQAKPLQFVLDVIPAYTTVTVVYDLGQVIRSCTSQQSPYRFVEEQIIARLQHIPKSEAEVVQRLVTIPVCYDVTVAPDLPYVAEVHGLSIEEVIAIHSSTTYHVYMIGFLPGFPYMASVDTRIATTRRTSPRTLVPAGSVGIAGDQTGIYPFSSPGGWQLIGRTPIKMFNAQQDAPTCLQPGDEVQFEPISLDTFNQKQRE